MMFEFICPKCGFHKNNLNAKFAGKKLKCPKCQAPAAVQHSNRMATPSDAAPQPNPPPPPPQADHATPQPNSGIPIFRDEAGNRLCRRCRGIIHENAKVCQHCRMWQDPSQYNKAFASNFLALSGITFGIPLVIGLVFFLVFLVFTILVCAGVFVGLQSELSLKKIHLREVSAVELPFHGYKHSSHATVQTASALQDFGKLS